MGGSVLAIPRLREEVSEMMQMVFVKIFLEGIKIALGPKSISVPGKECLLRLFSTGAVRAGLETGNAWLRLAFQMKISWFPTMVEKAF